ncbi:patatin-like phospholipase family protein [Carboxylicivirga linearis]|uniref:Patatin family protein n=1 Tax=Carboxylicivirga linearis TaxID=1628157 RepID=A0ABS5JUG3_9BACT|nr:patatin family protein [Carboxylicivirga linearis]MBS2098509.1 patatin family protein [Carboxylicivirga linearis]
MKSMNESTALVLEGGGFRGMFTSGVLDAFLTNEIYFPYCIGVSAGAAYGISYMSKQYERNRKVNLQYTADPRYMSWGNLIKKGNLFDWDFVYDEIPNKHILLDYDAILHSNDIFKIGITNAQTGKAEFIQANEVSKKELIQLCIASSSLPFVSKLADFRNQIYMDGGLSDSIPVEQALKDGNEKVVVVLTRNKEYRKKAPKLKMPVNWYYHKYPKLAEVILTRYERYNSTLDLIDQLEAEGKVYVIRPEEPMDVSRIENNPQKLDQLYLQGLQQMQSKITDLQEWLSVKEMTVKEM